jgi:hypothetical protein
LILDELRQLPRRMGAPAGVVFFAIAVLALGVLLPWYLNFGFFDVAILIAYACLSVMLVPPVVAESFADDQWKAAVANSANPRAILHAKVAAGALHGWISTVLIFTLAMLTTSAATRRWTVPSWGVLFDLAVISFAVSVFAASGAAAISVRAKSAKQAKRTLRQAFLLLLVIVIYGSRYLPGGWRVAISQRFNAIALIACAGLLIVAAGFLKLARVRAEDTEIRLEI